MIPIISISKNMKSLIGSLWFILVAVPIGTVYGQSILFDFNTAPIHTSLPINLSVGGITAQLSATGQGFSIQEAGVLGFTPLGFDGLCIYPNSVYAADLLISFDQTITDFSIMYSPQELGCDDSATMLVTAYMNTTLVGTNTATCPNPGTWPTGTLSCSFGSGFNNVVIHYANRPPTCQDYGVIFLADNMQVTPLNLSTSSPTALFSNAALSPNPVKENTILSFSLATAETISATVYDLSGKAIATLFEKDLAEGVHAIPCEFDKLSLGNGLYLLKINGQDFSQTFKVVVAK